MIQVGDLDLVKAVIELEIQVATQAQLIEKLINTNSVRFSQSDIDKAKAKAFEDVKNKYPQLGLSQNA